ncbi:MAG: hypothetical protein Q7T61_00930 [Caulobacter sp.]|nr:hypothetical protein [Caulobacter sp.]
MSGFCGAGAKFVPSRAAAIAPIDPVAPALAAIVAGFSSAPAAPRQAAMGNLISALMSAGIWAVCDRLYVFRNSEDQGSRINWRAPGTGNASKNGSPAFTVDVGFINTSGNDVATGFIPTTHGVFFTRNSNSFVVSTSVDANDVASAALAGNTQFSVNPRSSGGIVQTRNANSGVDSGSANTGAGLYGVCRFQGADYIPYKGATALTTITRASSALAAAEVFLGSSARASFSTKPCGLLFMGGYLDATAMAAFNTAWNAYVAAL